MQPPNDSTLLQQYANDHSDEAFAALVTRHVNLVYSVALRQVGHSQNAEEITQAVFIILAKKAAGLRHERALSSWLFQATRLTAINFVRSELRRWHHEQEAQMQTILNESGEQVWPKIAPLLDDAVARLRDVERRAIVLRFYEGRSLREVGLALGASEEAAKKRVARALEKLRQFFAKRGVHSTAAAIAENISANSVHAAPVGLAKAISAAAVAKGIAGGTSTLTLVKGALKIMAWTKTKTAIVAGVGLLLAAGTTTVVVEKAGKEKSQLIESYFVRRDPHYLDTAPPMVLLRRSKYANEGGYFVYGINKNGDLDGKILRRGAPFTEILLSAYGFGPEQMVLPGNLPRGKFDLLLTLTNDPRTALQYEIKKQFGVVAHPELRNTAVDLLRCVNPHAPALKVSQSHLPTSSWGPDHVRYTGYKISGGPEECDFVNQIGEYIAGMPVIDETGLTNFYDIDLHWGLFLKGNKLKNEVLRELKDQFGMALLPTNMPVEMLVVEKAK